MSIFYSSLNKSLKRQGLMLVDRVSKRQLLSKAYFRQKTLSFDYKLWALLWDGLVLF